mgnify:CR=1 FL=1
MPIIEKNTRKLREQLSDLKNEVTILLFPNQNSQDNQSTKQFFTEISDLNNKIKLEICKDTKKEDNYKIDKKPAALLLNHKGNTSGLHFLGIPAKNEIETLIHGIKLISGLEPELESGIQQNITSLNAEINFKIFITPKCPYCPKAVRTLQNLAYYTDKITVAIINITDFRQLAKKYKVKQIPKTVINETKELIGIKTAAEVLAEIKNLK